MPSDKDPDATPGVEPEDSSAPKSGQAQQPTIDWEARYKGQQRIYNALEAKFNKLTEDHEKVLGENEDLRNQLKSLNAEKGTLSEQLSTIGKEKETLQSKVQQHELGKERTSLILSEFSDLGPFEGKGLLPAAATVDEMRTKFAAFRETVEQLSGGKLSEHLKGGTPPGGGGGPAPQRTKNDIYNELTRLAGSRDPESRRKYDQLLAEWDTLNK